MTRFDTDHVRDAIVAVKQTHPDQPPDRIADRVGCSTERVEKTLADYDEMDVASTESNEWDDPGRCPFCGSDLEDAGAGFIEHVESSEKCAVSFARWREGVAGDVKGEWVG